MRFGFRMALVVAMFTAGCSTPKNKTGSPRLASIIVVDRSQEEIDAALLKVFEAHGYTVRHREDKLMFEKHGTFTEGFLHADLYSGPVSERIQVFQRELDAGRTLVDCDAFAVQEPDDPFFESAKPVHLGKKCQKLLDEVEMKLAK